MKHWGHLVPSLQQRPTLDIPERPACSSLPSLEHPILIASLPSHVWWNKGLGVLLFPYQPMKAGPPEAGRGVGSFFLRFIFFVYGYAGSSLPSLAVIGGGYSLVAMHNLLVVVVSLVVGHRL